VPRKGDLCNEASKLSVANYKSIEDSGDCYLSDRITILAGKNEAGKSSLLEALCDFNGERPMRPMLSQSNVLEL